MFPASTKGGGMAFAFPDVCKIPTPTGPIPTPFPNQGELPMAMPFALKVFIGNMPALHIGSKIMITSGDESGTLGGMLSGTFIGPGAFLLGSLTVIIEGNPGITVFKQTGQNGTSANMPMGQQISPSQATVLYGT